MILPNTCKKFSILTIFALLAVFSTNTTAQISEPIQPIPLGKKFDSQKVSLGELLFNDKRLSKDNSIACASCHDLNKGGADGKIASVGIGGVQGPINAPTVFNSSLNFRQFWDGRAGSLEEQVTDPIQNAKEMGSKWPEVLTKLQADANLAARFKQSYPDGIQPKNIQDAISTFEQSLLTPNSRFDKYLRGDLTAISSEELHGYQLFKNYGCIACHQGVNVGGNMFQKFGVMGDYFKKRGNITDADMGRFNVTKDIEDRYVFKVPSLRNIALTAPYFHDGSAKTLNDAVDVMFKYQLGRVSSKEDKEAIIKFLGTLTGEYKGKSLVSGQVAAK